LSSSSLLLLSSSSSLLQMIKNRFDGAGKTFKLDLFRSVRFARLVRKTARL